SGFGDQGHDRHSIPGEIAPLVLPLGRRAGRWFAENDPIVDIVDRQVERPDHVEADHAVDGLRREPGGDLPHLERAGTDYHRARVGDGHPTDLQRVDDCRSRWQSSDGCHQLQRVAVDACDMGRVSDVHVRIVMLDPVSSQKCRVTPFTTTGTIGTPLSECPSGTTDIESANAMLVETPLNADAQVSTPAASRDSLFAESA